MEIQSRVVVHEQHLGSWLSLDYKLKQKMQLFMQVFGLHKIIGL